jgi:hypothetical protein
MTTKRKSATPKLTEREKLALFYRAGNAEHEPTCTADKEHCWRAMDEVFSLCVAGKRKQGPLIAVVECVICGRLLMYKKPCLGE